MEEPVWAILPKQIQASRPRTRGSHLRPKVLLVSCSLAPAHAGKPYLVANSNKVDLKPAHAWANPEGKGSQKSANLEARARMGEPLDSSTASCAGSLAAAMVTGPALSKPRSGHPERMAGMF